MSLVAFNMLAGVAQAGPVNHAYNVCRDVCLPRTNAVLPRLRAIVTCYRAATGRHLDVETAAAVLDRIIATRDDMPYPVAYAKVADYLVRQGYDSGAIHHVIGHMARHRTVAGLDFWLAPDHRAEVASMLPAEPTRGQWGRDEDEDGEED